MDLKTQYLSRFISISADGLIGSKEIKPMILKTLEECRTWFEKNIEPI